MSAPEIDVLIPAYNAASTLDAAIGFAQRVAREASNEADARRATSVLYHVASAVYLAWEADRIHNHRGDARRLLLSRLVLDHRLAARDPFAIEAGRGEDLLTGLLLGNAPAPMREVAELVAAWATKIASGSGAVLAIAEDSSVHG